jgi:ribosome maturation factor RimP
LSSIAHVKLDGLDRERVLEAVLPVLRAHAVEAVELVWKTDRSGWLLELTLERPEARLPGEGVTIDLCSEISRDLSAALDVSEAISHRYRLEVGSPGLERRLYEPKDYQRFTGQLGRLKLKTPIDGQHVLHGTLQGLDERGQVKLQTERGDVLAIPLEEIENARLVFQMSGAGPRPGKGRRGPASGRGPGAQRP